MTVPDRVSVPIELIGLSAVFRHERRGDVTAVRDVDLTVAPGELLTLLGPSGCGKTTTLRMIAGFQEASTGRVVIGGEDITDLPANQRDIGVVFQSYALFPHLSVFDNVAYGLRVRRRPAARIAPEVGDALQLVGLSGFGDRRIDELSGGQQQRVALARAIVIQPRVLLFDEPLSNLDAKLRVQVRQEIADLQRRLGITTVYVTHDQDEAMAISTRIAVMDNGRIAQLGTAEELYRRPTSAFVASFLGRANLVAGTVQPIGAGRVRLTSADMSFDFACAVAVVPGAMVRAVIRPEAVGLAEPGTGAEIAGVVLDRTYLGEKVDYAVEIGGYVLQVTRSNPDPEGMFDLGSRVAVDLPRSGIQLIFDA